MFIQRSILENNFDIGRSIQGYETTVQIFERLFWGFPLSLQDILAIE
jgi:hypothetical protein